MLLTIDIYRLSYSLSGMARDKIVSWPTWALFVMFPPLAILAIIFFPITLLVVYWMYLRGKRQSKKEYSEQSDRSTS